ncbi:MAG TPA: hypothetical protein VM286_02775 [Candidatus Thermoplasmatota archaeon]|nr:hypothetical protein [Candidatus Thermoplasmatota archaeon]
MDIQTAASVGQLAAILAALAIGIVLVRQSERKARNQAAIDLIDSFAQADLRRAYPLVRDLPDDCDPDEIRVHPELRTAAETLDFFYETKGLMVERGVITVQEFDAVLGPSCRMAWRKLRVYVRQERQRSGNASYGEWFERLVHSLGPDPAAPVPRGIDPLALALGGEPGGQELVAR